MPGREEYIDYGCEQFLYGMPLAGARRILGAELSKLKGQVRRRRLVYMFWFLAGPGALIAGLSAYAYNVRFGIPGLTTADHLTLIWLLAVIMLATSPLLFRARRRWLIYRHTAGAEALRVFKGMADRYLAEDIHKKRLAPRATPVTAGEDVTVEMFRGSGAVYSINGSRARRWGELTVTSAARVAAHPEYEKVRSSDGEGYVYIRKMFAGELGELKRYKRFGRTWPYILMVLLLACIIAGLGHAAFGSTVGGVIFIGLSVIGVIAVLVHGFRETADLRKDYKRAAILAYTKEQLLRDEPDFPLRNVGLLDEEYVETLPESRALWREGSMPAQWRDGCG